MRGQKCIPGRGDDGQRGGAWLGRMLGGPCTWETSSLVAQLVKNLPAVQESQV